MNPLGRRGVLSMNAAPMHEWTDRLAGSVMSAEDEALEREFEARLLESSTLAFRVAALGVPLKLEIVLSRYQGDKKVSSSPFELSIQAGGRCSLRMGVEVPVPMPNGGFNYRNVGTNIDCTATRVDDARYSINLTVEDSTVQTEEQRLTDTTPRANAPSFRTFRSMSAVVLRDRQTGQFTVATDKVTGEVLKADVTLTVVR